MQRASPWPVPERNSAQPPVKGTSTERRSNVRHRFIAAVAGAATIVLLATAPLPVSAQNRRPAEPAKPTPRWPDGTRRFSAAPGEKGLWHPNGRPILSEPETDPEIKDGQGRGAFSGPPFPGKPKQSEVPFQPWARALYEY